MRRFWLVLFLLLLNAVVGFGVWYYTCANNRFFAEEIPTAEGDLKVGALNVCGFRYLDNSAFVQEVLLATAKDNNLDVLLLQEFPTYPADMEARVLKQFKSYFPYISKKDECAVLSKIPILDHERKFFYDLSGSYSSITLGYSDSQFKVIAVHLRTTGLSTAQNGRAVESVDDALSLRMVMSTNSDIRNVQAESIYNEVKNTPMPLIVAGDFNTLPFSKAYRIIKGDLLQDSFYETGKGKGSTYRLLKDQIRIDYILYNSGFYCLSSQILDEELSDHRMVVSTFLWQ